MINVLFVDADNGSRSKMAAAFLAKYGSLYFTAHSAGARAGHSNQYAEEVMQEINIDISKVPSKDVRFFINSSEPIHYIIVLCREQDLKHCDVFPSSLIRLHWMFADPVLFEGPDQQITEQYRQQRGLIKRVVKQFIKEIQLGHFHLIEDLNFETAIR